ncbi:MAG: hypothetical protein KF819_33345 [Labilithrix sp.]|nr:hypothetical protein [Labilithrix sp.]
MKRRRHFGWFGSIAALLAFLPRAAEAAPTARLVYLRGPGAESCPGEGELRDAVAARLGYDPFATFALDTLFTEIDKEGAGYVARVKLVSHDNTVRGARALRGDGACSDLVASLALTISIAIDPLALTRQGRPEGLPPEERPVEPIPDDPRDTVDGVEAVDDPPEAPLEPAQRVRFTVGAGGAASMGTAPGAALGFLVFGRARYGDVSLTVEGRADLVSSADADGPGRVSSSLVALTLLPCGHSRWFFGCARASLGSLTASGLDVASPGSSNAVWGAVGARLGLDIPLHEVLSLRIHADGDVVVTRYELRFGDRQAFRYPAVAGGAGVALAATFR